MALRSGVGSVARRGARHEVRRGFTLVEMLVVMAALALLLSIAAPRYAEHVDRAREVVLRHNLAAARDAIDKFLLDRARYPSSLQELVQQRYLRSIPVDPVTNRADTWVIVPASGQGRDSVADLRSGAVGNGSDGTPYGSW